VIFIIEDMKMHIEVGLVGPLLAGVLGGYINTAIITEFKWMCRL